MKKIYDDLSYDLSRIITKKYTTSFAIGIRFLAPQLRNPIYAIYGFVRVADEIVDSFHGYNKEELLDEFENDCYKAIDTGISTNPVLQCYQEVVNKYGIERELITLFIKSMRMDLNKKEYSEQEYKDYILGSAEVVGLMCLRVFLEGNEKEYQRLKPSAMALGSAFQKINFLRDLKADVRDLGRVYFPNIDISVFNDDVKKELEADIQQDFDAGFEGIKQLPKKARFGVYLAYIYYTRLFNKVKKTPANVILKERLRIPDPKKYALFFQSYVRHQVNIL
ncbi:phytoene/squalene synthase family protein [Flammeovirga kamogawensis]|uniref:Phytoene/squalene synthase family protein n=1 Tax=Flammeovirga kamogawensis TaxID=373891 RepID=A0ABX8GZN4_9BACT|nr:phytoene/squalene synthase family protein [Flammeovirga kamogawensis]MBB6462809.1 phytoene/squalene synthetase [Flammeovirga kamogawensis]QWG08405.1 phytoene/squalene synthase family protein [Flammeovirga kamogawensis]TRX66701.1 phytoene/squalene synthase family protein [Flammeovirga kamogawensis]